MKTNFLKHFAVLFLFIGTSTAFLTSCSSDDGNSTIYPQQKGEINAIAEQDFSINPEIETPNTLFYWFDTTVNSAQISTKPILNHKFDEPGKYEITLKTFVNEIPTNIYIYKVNVVDNDYVKLNLSDFDLTNGIETTGGKVWSDTYTEDAVLQSSIFKFSHLAVPDWYFWTGFTVSNAADNENHLETTGDWVANQWGTMPKGGVDGIGSPFLVAFADHKPADGILSPNQPIDITQFSCSIELTDNENTYEAISTKVAISPWAYYGILNGDSFARKFEEGDYFALHVYGVNKDMKLTSETPVTHYFVDFRDGIAPISTHWNEVDLSSLGEVKYLLFFLETTDVGEWGANTALYFTMDKLIVKKTK